MARGNELAAQVRAVNRANDYANKLYPTLAAFFRPLIGDKVTKSDGSLLQKFEKLLPEMPHTREVTVYYHRSDYSLAWTVKTCENVEQAETCVYHEVTVYVCDLRNGRIEKMSNHFGALRTDYTVEEIESKRENCRILEKAYSAAKSALDGFGEY